MNSINKISRVNPGLTLVLGATGKTGTRVVNRLANAGFPFRRGSRAATPSFHWNNEEGWDACLDSVEAIYINYAPDLAIPGAADSIQALVNKANQHGVKRLVILSGRGEAEAQACEKIVQESGMEWTVVRASWFNQNFSEGAFVDMVRAGEITLPVRDIAEPFVDADDIADVVTAALTETGHAGEVYEVTGPRLLTFKNIAEELSRAANRPVTFTEIPHNAFIDGVAQSGAPTEVVWLMDYLLATIMDGRNAYLTDGVERALGRPPKDFSDYASEIAASGIWRDAA